MSKKRRVRRVAKNGGAASAIASAQTTAPAPEAPRSIRRGATTEELKQEYAYVVKDLRRVFFIAALMFALLIVLNIVLS